MKELRDIEMCLISLVQAQCGDLKKVHAAELGEVVDMIKDLEEAIYYCSITKAMEKSNEYMVEMDKRDISRHIYSNKEHYMDDLDEDKQMISDKLATKIK